MFPGRDVVFGRLRALVAGADRTEISDWATRYASEGDDDPDVDHPAWDALTQLTGADLPTTDREYLHGQEDFEAWLADLLTAVAHERAQLLFRAGLVLLGTVDQAAGVTPVMAWNRVVRGDDPAVVVDGFSIAVDTAWLDLTRERGFFTADGSFLVSTTGSAETALPWAKVRLGERPRLAEVLVAHPGEPEFVAMSMDGTMICGVTTEEHGVWIMWRDTTEPGKASP